MKEMDELEMLKVELSSMSEELDAIEKIVDEVLNDMAAKDYPDPFYTILGGVQHYLIRLRTDIDEMWQRGK